MGETGRYHGPLCYSEHDSHEVSLIYSDKVSRQLFGEQYLIRFDARKDRHSSGQRISIDSFVNHAVPARPLPKITNRS